MAIRKLITLKFPAIFLLAVCSACSIQNQATVTHKLYPLQTKSGDPITLSYSGIDYNPPLNITNAGSLDTTTLTKETKFILNMIDVIKNKDAKDFVSLWDTNRDSVKGYLDYPDVWSQFKDYIKTAKGFYVVNVINYGRYKIVKLMIETSDKIEQKYHFKSYVLKDEDNKLVLTSDLDNDIGLEILRSQSKYIAATMGNKKGLSNTGTQSTQ